DAIATLESDKATMDVPSSHAGVVQDLRVKVGDRVGQGSVLLTLATSAAPASPAPATSVKAPSAPAAAHARADDRAGELADGSPAASVPASMKVAEPFV